MATATSRKRFIKCVQCETTSILPGASENNGTGATSNFRIVPFADMDFRPSIALLTHRTPTLSVSKSFLPVFVTGQTIELSLSSGAGNLEATLRTTTLRSHSATLLTLHLEASMLGA